MFFDAFLKKTQPPKPTAPPPPQTNSSEATAQIMETNVPFLQQFVIFKAQLRSCFGGRNSKSIIISVHLF